MDIINGFVNWMNSWLWSDYLLPVILIAGGIFLTIRTGAVQLRLFPEMFKVVSEKPENKDGVSSFGALMVSTASRVGTGNIIGVCTAIIAGGPGAIFWMWITAILGGASAFVESTLAQIYKKKDEDGTFYGGPSYYMQNALGQRWLGVLFSVLIIFTYAVGYNLLAAFNLNDTLKTFSWHGGATSASVIVGIVLAVIFAACILGGAKKLINVTGALVPVMGILYVVVSLVVLVMNAKNLGAMFGMIFSNAFDFQAIFGGFAGSCIMLGFKRGLYSNEAGMGSAPNAAAKADVAHPVKQGLVQSLSVFIDTLLICTATAFMTLSTVGISPADFNTADGVQAAGYVQACLHEALGGFGPIFIAVSMSLFAFTTLIGNYSYCEGCLAFILKRDLTKTEALIFRIIASLVVFAGPIATASLAWNTADMMQGLMVLTNIPSILILSGVAGKALKDYTDQKKAGKDPVFKAANIGLDESKVDCWK